MFNIFKNKEEIPLTWEQKYARSQSGHGEMLAEDVFSDWEQTKFPDDMGGIDLVISLRIKIARGNNVHAYGFAERAFKIIERTFSENLIIKCAEQDLSDENDILLRETQALYNLVEAKIVLGQNIDIESLRLALNKLKEGIKSEYKCSYIDPVEYDLLRATLFALVIKDEELAEYFYHLVKAKKKKYNEKFVDAIEECLAFIKSANRLDKLKHYIEFSSYPVFPNYSNLPLSIRPVTHQFELGLLYASLTSEISIDDCDVNKIVDIVNPQKLNP